jgi:drug/metabolite transporter (DMT)-like permease
VAVTAVVAPLASLALGETWQLAYSAWAWTSITLQVVLGSFGSLLAWMWLLRHYPATRLSTFVFLTPILSLVLGNRLLGEPLTLQLGLALCGVVAGIWLVNRRTPPPAPSAADAASGDRPTRT